MGLRCSLLGHDYGDSFVERDREERGNEVVVTERELKECARCGAEKVTTENTEVRSLQAGGDTASPDASDQAAEATGAPGAAASDAGTTTADERASAGADDGAAASEGGSAFSSPADAIEQAEADAASTGGTSTDDAVTADADAGGEDAVILDDDADDGPRSEQWDEPEDVDPDAPAPEPTPSPDDEDVEFVGSGPSDDATAAADDEATADAGAQAGQEPNVQAGQQADAQAGAATTADADRARGEWPDPEEADDEGFDASPNADPTDSSFEFGDDEVVEADTGFTSAGPLETAERTEADDLDYTLYCPECGLEQYAGGSSLRAGDICPECKKGYLAEDR